MSSAHPLLHLLLLRLVHQEHVVHFHQQAHQQNSLEYAQTILYNLVLSILTVISVVQVQIMQELLALETMIAGEVVLVFLMQFVLLTVSP